MVTRSRIIPGFPILLLRSLHHSANFLEVAFSIVTSTCCGGVARRGGCLGLGNGQAMAASVSGFCCTEAASIRQTGRWPPPEVGSLST
jgi:hypothetical protein